MEARDTDKHPAMLRTATHKIDSSDPEYQLLKFKSSALHHSVFENISSFVYLLKHLSVSMGNCETTEW